MYKANVAAKIVKPTETGDKKAPKEPGPSWYLHREESVAMPNAVSPKDDFRSMLIRKWHAYERERGWTIDRDEWLANPALEMTSDDEQDEEGALHFVADGLYPAAVSV